MKYIIASVILLCGFANAGEIEVGQADFESLDPFCH